MAFTFMPTFALLSTRVYRLPSLFLRSTRIKGREPFNSSISREGCLSGIFISRMRHPLPLPSFLFSRLFVFCLCFVRHYSGCLAGDVVTRGRRRVGDPPRLRVDMFGQPSPPLRKANFGKAPRQQHSIVFVHVYLAGQNERIPTNSNLRDPGAISEKYTISLPLLTLHCRDGEGGPRCCCAFLHASSVSLSLLFSVFAQYS